MADGIFDYGVFLTASESMFQKSFLASSDSPVCGAYAEKTVRTCFPILNIINIKHKLIRATSSTFCASDSRMKISTPFWTVFWPFQNNLSLPMRKTPFDFHLVSRREQMSTFRLSSMSTISTERPIRKNYVAIQMMAAYAD
ncbi:hypothetical protein HELRODRAFT_165843 [Helobdella robusta]|uniref:Uncharacterized protein n=1 Tax=Helobdella robusta TaxID=6412 RepID=T1EXC8_HELRO|nr:hypothetical protein HELRODRAFT_165843 [Helobdella robusta]ESN91771.1 hypothetical protein HELRODRAFT_165843 [Helobdella robusta]